MVSQRSVARSRSEPNGFARELFSGLPDRYDLLADVLSFGQNRRWHAALVDAIAQSKPSRILDVATGTGTVARRHVAATGADVVGIDVTPAMLRQARARLTGEPVRFVAGRAEQLPFPDASFDACSVTYLLRYVADPAATIAEIVRVVRPGGTVVSMDFGVPSNPLWHAAWRAYTRVGLPVGGALTGGRAWWDVGRFLGPSISEHDRRYPVDWTVQAWREAGLTDVRVRAMSLGGGVLFQGRRG